MKIVSWNVNGLAACKRKGFLRVVSDLKADVFCCQEIKTVCPLNTPGYLQYWNPAQRPGYSGTLVLARKKPLAICYGMGDGHFDNEGRLISLEYDDFYVINVYVPNSQASLERLDYRISWDAAFLNYLGTLDKPAILCGDFNVARDYIDIYPENLRNEEKPPGFQSEEREGMDRLLASGFMDVFRSLYPQKEGAYTWWSNRLNKRLENRGWRLDYFLISESIFSLVKDCVHHTDILGSDHAPVSLTLQPFSPRKELTGEDMAAMWRGLDWGQIEEQLLQLQQQLARAAFNGHWSRVTELQKRLVRSFSAKALAVRHVAQVNSEAGIDGVRWRTDEEKMRAALSLTSKGYRAKPYRRIIIEDGGKNRRIHVPTAYDKAMQALYAYSLDPVAESIADKKSFAFRKGRSMLDAHGYICQVFDANDPPAWIVKADVRACYDSISHDWLLKNTPMDRKVLREFLRAGAVFDGELFPTEIGISQGATLSPILGNLALDGLQKYIYNRLYPDAEIDYPGGNLIRYADDLIISARSYKQAESILEIVKDFLAVRGLELHPDKTYVRKASAGFEFLSRWYQYKDGILNTHPSDKAVKDFERRLERFIMDFHGSQKTLIEKLNRKLSGWANYHRVTDAYETFRHIDAVVQGLLIRKMRDLHPRRQWKHIQNHYWRRTQDGKYIFCLPDKPMVQVIQLADAEIISHKPVRTGFHPYLDQEYYAWLQRRRDIQKVSGSKRRSIWHRQDGKCYYCGSPMLPDQEIDLVEITFGVGRKAQNLAYIHRRCAYDRLDDNIGKESLDFFTMLDGVTDTVERLEDPYWALREFFRLYEKSSVTLTFKEIEEMIGDSLDWEARYYKAFWFDEAPGITSELWDEFPVWAVKPSDREYAIAESWVSQGYQIQRLDLTNEKVVFHRKVYGIAGVTIPPRLTQAKIPEKAAYELQEFFKYLIGKYAL